MVSSKEEMESLMLTKGPLYGGLEVREWDSLSSIFDYTVIFNDSTVHALPILLNLVNNARYSFFLSLPSFFSLLFILFLFFSFFFLQLKKIIIILSFLNNEINPDTDQ